MPINLDSQIEKLSLTKNLIKKFNQEESDLISIILAIFRYI